ncbi:MAG: hypothetical protein ACRDCW_00140 [Sarcina sp.]
MIPLDDMLTYLNEQYQICSQKNQMKDYNFLLYGFLAPEINTNNIDNLRPYKSTVRCRKNTGEYYLDIDNNSSSSDLTDQQVKKLQELNNYLKQSGVMKSIKKDQMKIIIPFCIVVISIFVLIFLAKNKVL